MSEAADPIGYWARHDLDRVALVDRRTDTRLSYGELDALAARWTGLLRSLDVGPGDRVGALSGNRVELIALFLACGRRGAALVPYNWRLAAPELAVIVGDSDPSVVFHDPGSAELAEKVRDALGGWAGESGEGVPRAGGPEAGRSRAPESSEIRWLDLDDDVPGLLAEASPWGIEQPADKEAPVLILYTSGTTGRPKGALLPHRQRFHNGVATTTAWELGPDDVAPITTPLFHTGGWNVFATPLWQRGGRVVLFEDFDPAGFLHALAEERCTVALTVPTQLLLMQRSDAWGLELPALRFFISGGAPCPPAVAAAVRAAGYRFKEGYGLTECGPNCFSISLDEAERHPGVVGRPVPSLRTRRVDEDGHDVGPGEAGELLLQGPQLFAGYLNDPVRTREAFTADGWLRTGDIARMDHNGLHTICGRRKEMFISGGENIFPAEVEAVLSDAPGVAEVVVVGVPHATWGEVGRAYVVPEEGAASAGFLEDVRRFAADRLARYKVPASFAEVDVIPRLGSGKPDRRALAERAAGEVVKG